MKKRALIIIGLILVWVIIGVAQLLYDYINDPGWTSGTIRVFIDGNERTLNNVTIPVEFSFTEDSNGSTFSGVNESRGNDFTFRRSQYALYFINFSLEPNIWGDSGQAIDFEVQYFCSNRKEAAKFDIRISVITEAEKTVELIASEGNSTISSGIIPIEPSGMTISVYIPSP